jgi:hypothetical protein
MPLDLFAGIRVSDYETAKAWFERLLGAEPAFIPHATEAVWELAEHRFLYIYEDAEGRSIATPTATRSASAARSRDGARWPAGLADEVRELQARFHRAS